MGGGRGNQARFGKSKGQMAELRRALDSVYGAHSELFAYGSLFAEDREMNQNDFGEAFRDQAPPPPPMPEEGALRPADGTARICRSFEPGPTTWAMLRTVWPGDLALAVSLRADERHCEPKLRQQGWPVRSNAGAVT